MQLGRFFRKKDNEKLKEMASQLEYAMVLGDAQRNDPDRAVAEQAGVNIHAFKDANLEHALSELRKIRIVDTDGKSKYIGDDLDFVALEMLVSPMIKLAYISPLSAQILKCEAELLIAKMSCRMDSETYNNGGANLLRVVLFHVRLSLDDSIDGKLFKWVKTQPRTLEVNAQALQQPRR